MLLINKSTEASFAEVVAVPVPPQTDSYRPVPYGQAITFLREAIASELNMPIASERYGLNTEGKQLFAMARLDTGNPDFVLSIGLRQSYNKSLPLGVAVGANVLVCDNLCFSGDAFTVVRKNTVNVWRDFVSLVTRQVAGALAHFGRMEADIQTMRGFGCTERQGYALLGIAQGNELLTPHQASVAYGDWRKPRYEDFAERNLWSLYNCFTEGLKKGPAGLTIDRHAQAHRFMMRTIEGGEA